MNVFIRQFENGTLLVKQIEYLHCGGILICLPFMKIESFIIYIFLLTMELPEDVLRIIREYSKPLTRPDWRTLHKMTNDSYLVDFYEQHRNRLYYINNHPERDFVFFVFRISTYKPVFHGQRYQDMFMHRLL